MKNQISIELFKMWLAILTGAALGELISTFYIYLSDPFWPCHLYFHWQRLIDAALWTGITLLWARFTVIKNLLPPDPEEPAEEPKPDKPEQPGGANE